MSKVSKCGGLCNAKGCLDRHISHMPNPLFDDSLHRQNHLHLGKGSTYQPESAETTTRMTWGMQRPAIQGCESAFWSFPSQSSQLEVCRRGLHTDPVDWQPDLQHRHNGISPRTSHIPCVTLRDSHLAGRLGLLGGPAQILSVSWPLDAVKLTAGYVLQSTVFSVI